MLLTLDAPAWFAATFAQVGVAHPVGLSLASKAGTDQEALSANFVVPSLGLTSARIRSFIFVGSDPDVVGGVGDAAIHHGLPESLDRFNHLLGPVEGRKALACPDSCVSLSQYPLSSPP